MQAQDNEINLIQAEKALIEKCFKFVPDKEKQEWLEVLLESAYERYLRFKKDNQGFTLDMVELNRRMLEFKGEVYEGWTQIYKNSKELSERNGSFNLEAIKNQCQALLNQCKANSYESCRILAAARGEAYISTGHKVYLDTEEWGEYEALLEANYQQAITTLENDLENLRGEAPGKLEFIMTALENHKTMLNQGVGSLWVIKEPYNDEHETIDATLKKIAKEKEKRLLKLLADHPEDLLEFQTIVTSDLTNTLFGYRFSPCLYNEAGNTLLHEAIENDQEELVRLLLEYGADPFLLNAQGFSSLKLAQSLGKTKILHNILGFICKKPLNRKNNRIGRTVDLCFDPSHPFYGLEPLETVEARDKHEEKQALEGWQDFSRVKAKLDKVTVDYLISSKILFHRIFGVPKTISDCLEEFVDIYEALYTTHKAGDVDGFRQYFLRMQLPKSTQSKGRKISKKLAHEIQSFLDKVVYATQQLKEEWESTSFLESTVQEQAGIILLLERQLEAKDQIIVSKDQVIVSLGKEIEDQVQTIAILNEENHDLSLEVKGRDEKISHLIEANENLMMLNENLMKINQEVRVTNEKLETKMGTFEEYMRSQQKRKEEKRMRKAQEIEGKNSAGKGDDTDNKDADENKGPGFWSPSMNF